MEAWHLGGLVVPWAESFPWPWDLFLACDCGKRLEIRGFAGGQAYFDELMKYIFTYSQIFIGNWGGMIHVPCVASKQGTPTITKPTMNKYTTKLDLPREIEIPTADLWLSTGAITITDIGEENTYYTNEFGHLFFCKNYPSHDCQAQIYI